MWFCYCWCTDNRTRHWILVNQAKDLEITSDSTMLCLLRVSSSDKASLPISNFGDFLSCFYESMIFNMYKI